MRKERGEWNARKEKKKGWRLGRIRGRRRIERVWIFRVVIGGGRCLGHKLALSRRNSFRFFLTYVSINFFILIVVKIFIILQKILATTLAGLELVRSACQVMLSSIACCMPKLTQSGHWSGPKWNMTHKPQIEKNSNLI